jgi:hypothetical protein
MQFDYSRWKGPRPEDLEFLKQLMEIYRNLLLQTGGDVEEALQWMERFGEQYGFFNEKFGIADFKKMLEQTGEVERTPKGFQITPKGEERIRQDSLNEIFSALRAGAVVTIVCRWRTAWRGSPRHGPGSSATRSPTSTRSAR